MHHSVQPENTVQTTKESSSPSSRFDPRRGFVFFAVALTLGSFALSQIVRAVSPTPDGGYANSNTAVGDAALSSNVKGHENTASGVQALYYNTTGHGNVANGLNALYSNTIGSDNIAVGSFAGYALTIGSNNIDIGNNGVPDES